MHVRVTAPLYGALSFAEPRDIKTLLSTQTHHYQDRTIVGLKGGRECN
jgi:hypothetical protein